MDQPRPRRLVGTSLKMYFSIEETLQYIRDMNALRADLPTTNCPDLFVIPDFLTILDARRILHDTTPSSPSTRDLDASTPPPIALGAQDAFWAPAGAYTGEVSPRSLAQAGVRYVELGHAERRRLFGERDSDVARKAAAAVAEGLVPLVCVGERNRAGDFAVDAAADAAVTECEPQVRAVLDAVGDEAEVVLAYEPVWAIGAAEPAGAEHVVAVARRLREMVSGRKGVVRILYGGSAGPGTFGRLKDGVDGLFLGRFAHDVKNFAKVVRELAEA